jgi:hypothetical protein
MLFLIGVFLSCFDWEILSDQEHHIDTIFVQPTSSNVVESSFDFDAPPEQNFFEYIFPLCQRSCSYY